MNPTPPLPLLVVAVCTYRRNHPLRALLTALEAQAASLTTVRLGVSVVDDSPEGMARPVLEPFADSFVGGLRYSNPASGNISTARNTAIETSLDMGADWVMFIDDDCLPSERWIAEMLAMQARTGADLITGPVEDIAHPAAPNWLTEQPFLNQIAEYTDGEEPPYGTTANVLISAEWLAKNPEVRFRSDFGDLGGEDMVWFHATRAAGIVHRYALAAPVFEQVPLERSSFGYQLRKKLWFGNTMYVTNADHGESLNRLFLRGAKYVVNGLLRPVKRLRGGETPQWRYAAAMVAIGVGLMAGRFGVRLDHH
ncbi:MAG: glycosyltransferase family 2 protein [Actinobacteria bacterium]|nr:glycosyltransferase family 2 protein [Actinomycetota bacterium]